MCGIFAAFLETNNAPELVFKGLSDIEYRGYDSWGVASFDKTFKIKKEIGFLPKKAPLSGAHLSLGHTRWATHGGVAKLNAHPHSDCSGKLVIVHNGIVENFQALKATLKGHVFKSETDTEIIVHLIEDELKKTKSLEVAAVTVFKKLAGLNAIVVSDGSTLVACKKGSPLVLGRVKHGLVIASDPNAILPTTRELIFLEDDQMIVFKDQKFVALDILKNKILDLEFTKVDWEYAVSDMKKYPHFMLKEIYEQPKVLTAAIDNIPELKKIAEKIKVSFGTYLIGCGTAGFACLLGTYLFSKIAKKHVNFSIGSEFNYTEDFLTDKSLLIAISQSGETIDIVEPATSAKKRKANVVAITNTLGSTLYRLSDQKVLLQAGVEKAVASTKAFIAMAAHIVLLSFILANKAKEGEKVIQASSKEVAKILKQTNKIKALASKIYKAEHIYCLGRGTSYPIALEAALKIKETSYIHAEGFAAGELKHGAIALIDKKTPVIVFVPNDETKDATLSNAIEVKSRGAYVIGVGAEENSTFDFFFKVADVGASSVLPNVVFAQLLAYFLSIKKGINPDKPRNLAKSVVVR